MEDISKVLDSVQISGHAAGEAAVVGKAADEMSNKQKDQLDIAMEDSKGETEDTDTEVYDVSLESSEMLLLFKPPKMFMEVEADPVTGLQAPVKKNELASPGMGQAEAAVEGAVVEESRDKDLKLPGKGKEVKQPVKGKKMKRPCKGEEVKTPVMSKEVKPPVMAQQMKSTGKANEVNSSVLVKELESSANAAGQESSPALPQKTVTPLNEAPDLVLTKEQAAGLVKRRLLESQSIDNIETLVTALQLHLIPIQLAIGYIRNDLAEDPNPGKSYMELKDWYQEYSADEKLTEVEKATYQAFSVTFECLLENEVFDPKPILAGLSCLQSKNIPVKILEGVEGISTSASLRAAVELFKKYSIISSNTEDEMLGIHPLVQRAIQLTLSPEEIKFGLINMLKIFTKYVDPSADDRESAIPLFPHAESLWNHAMKFGALIPTFSYFPCRLCTEYESFGMSNDVLRIAQASLPCIEGTFGKLHLATISLQLSKACALFKIEMFEESLDLLNELRPLCNPEHRLLIPPPMVVMILFLYCDHLSHQKNYESKLEVLEQIEAIQLKVVGPKHKVTLQTVHQKAFTLLQLKKSDDALKLFRYVYKLRKQVLGVNHVCTQLTKQYIDKIVNDKRNV